MEHITFKEYSKKAQESRDCPDELVYGILGLTEEAGEVSGKIKKYWRDKIYLHPNDYDFDSIPREDRDAIIKELGDVLWYLNDIALHIGTTLNEVAVRNLAKIKDRVERGTIHGAGDNR